RCASALATVAKPAVAEVAAKLPTSGGYPAGGAAPTPAGFAGMSLARTAAEVSCHPRRSFRHAGETVTDGMGRTPPGATRVTRSGVSVRATAAGPRACFGM